MRTFITALVAASIVAGLVGAAPAAPRKKHRHAYGYAHRYSPSEIRERQRHASTFDETEYYEHLSSIIPFGTATWWRQKDRERGGR